MNIIKIKRILSVFFLSFSCLVLCSCNTSYKSAEAIAVDELIEAIGEVTLDSGYKISKAENAANNLTEADYKKLENLDTLEKARNGFNLMKATELEDAINSIGDVSLENDFKVHKAKLLYGEASSVVREMLPNYHKLVEAEEKLSVLKVQQVIDTINNIGNPNFDEESTVIKADKLYKELNKEEKNKVVNSAILESARVKYDEILNPKEEIKIPIVPDTPIIVPEINNPTMGEQNALSSAKMYLEVMAFSYSGLIDQLQFDGYTYDEAVYGANNCGANWSAQAGAKAWEYLNVMSFSKQGLIDQLIHDGFTREQAEFGVSQAGY